MTTPATTPPGTPPAAPAATPPATLTATTSDGKSATTKKEKVPLTRITKLTHDSLLKAAAVVYPRHNQAEIIEIALQALLGEPQPIIHCQLYDPAHQLENAAKLVEVHEYITNKARVITRATLADKGDQAAAGEAIKELRVGAEELRTQIKEIAADARQAKIIINAARQHIAGATALAKSVKRVGKEMQAAIEQGKLKNDAKLVEEQTSRFAAVKAQHHALVSLIKILIKTEETQP